METKNQNNPDRQMDKQALNMYAQLAVIVYIFALMYCISTRHLFESWLLGGVMLGLGGFIRWVYRN